MNPARQAATVPGKRLLIPGVIVIGSVALTVWVCCRWSTESPETLLQQAQKHFVRAQYERAEDLASRAIEIAPQNRDARIIAAESALAGGDPERAFAHLAAMTTEAWFDTEAAAFAAELLHNHLFRFADAERMYQSVLNADPEHAAANEGLAKLFAVCGRRFEAIPHIIRLVRMRQPSDLLLVLARESGAISDEELLRKAVAAEPMAAGPLLGLARLADSDRLPGEAIRYCRLAVQRQPGMMAAHAELGRYLLETEAFDALGAWEKQLPVDSESYPAIQKVLGFLELHRGDPTAAFAAFVTCARLAPDSKEACYQLSQLLFAMRDKSTAEAFADRVREIQHLHESQDRALFSGNEVSAAALIEMIGHYVHCDRVLEAYGWAQLGFRRFPDNEALGQRVQQMATLCEDAPLQLVRDADNRAIRLSLKSDILAEPVRTQASDDRSHASDSAALPSLSFLEQSDDIGLSFRYMNGVGGISSRRMFTYTGGGVAVGDFDGDDFPDVFFSQGGDWALRGTPGNARDMLFRNIRGIRFADCSEASSVRGADFGQGVAIGDYDNDGFPDLLVANIESILLWHNNGDGTFSDVSSDSLPVTEADAWMTSAAVADLNGDALPDLYVAGYLSGNDVLNRICADSDGRPEVCSPSQFSGADDRLLLNNGEGGFADVSATGFTSAADGKGLGVLVFDPVGNGRAAICVANDTTPNFLLLEDEFEPGNWTDAAFSAGLAVSALGKAEGSMGIALGDPDHDGNPDLVMTNFLYESHAFFRGLGGGLFRDDRTDVEIRQPSLSVLGFGTQFLDADLDGSTELFVANGHIDDLRHLGRPYQMPAQMFAYRSGRFRLMDHGSLGSYFARNHLGRAVARIDWNTDGRPDLVIGHLEEPSMVLTNTTAAQGNWLSLRLVGTSASRDAVCSNVRVQIGNVVQTQQVSAGDGYQCSNEKLLIFGCGQPGIADLLTVRWSSGAEQVFSSVPLPARLIVVEGRSVTYACPR